MLSPSTSQPGQRAKRAACDRCRTQKLRCDRPPQLPGHGRINPLPCIRCTRLGSVCTTSPAQRLGRPTVLWTEMDPPLSQRGIHSNVMEQISPASLIPTPWENQSNLMAHYTGTNTPRSTYTDLTPGSVTSISSCNGDTPDLEMTNPFDGPEQDFPRSSSMQCTWKSTIGIPPDLGPNYMQEDSIDPMLEQNVNTSKFDIPGSSLDSLMATVLEMDTAPYPLIRPQPSSSASESRHQMKAESSNESLCERKLSELLELGMQFVANIEAYRSATEENIERRRSILQNCMSTSGKLLSTFESMTQRGASLGSNENSELSDSQALLAQVSSCYILEARQWNIILNLILRDLKQSPGETHIIAQVIPSTRMEGLVLDNTLLQARFFLQACMHTAQALCKQMDSLVDLISEPGSTSINTKGVLKGVRSIHAELLGILERHNT